MGQWVKLNRTVGRSTATSRRGIATLWTILTLPVLVLLACWAIEAGRLYLARQQLVTAMESAALAGVKHWCEGDGVTDTLEARQMAQQFSLANIVIDHPVSIDVNYGASNAPNQNADCEGELLFGTMREEADGRRVFYSGLKAGCGGTDGPKAHATLRVSSGGWQTVVMCHRDYDSMVVVGTPVYENSDRPMVVRVRNAGAGNSFEYFVQDTNSGAAVTGVPVHFFVVEEGVYTEAAHGVKMEAAKHNSTITDHGSSWRGQEKTYANGYTRPVVVGQVMTYNDPDWSVFWEHGRNRGIPPGGRLFVGKHVGQDPDRTRANETLGYVVVEEGTGSMGGLPYYASLGPDTVVGMLNGAPNTYTLPTNIASYVTATKAAEAGGNGAWVVAYGPDPLRIGEVDFGLDEYRLTDRRHTTEPVAHIVFGGPCVVRARGETEVSWLCGNLFGCTLFPTRVTAEVFAMVDCDKRCSKLICVDEVVCP